MTDSNLPNHPAASSSQYKAITFIMFAYSLIVASIGIYIIIRAYGAYGWLGLSVAGWMLVLLSLLFWPVVSVGTYLSSHHAATVKEGR